jgi:hypothetical protein
MWKERYMPIGPNTLPTHNTCSDLPRAANRLPNKFLE